MVEQDNNDDFAAKRAEQRARAEELVALQQLFPYLRHDTAFQNALLQELQSVKAKNHVTNMEAATHIKSFIANNAALSALLPAYEKLVAEIERYNRNPLDNRWLKDTSCWEKFVTAERAKRESSAA